jgi:hypothetical protein
MHSEFRQAPRKRSRQNAASLRNLPCYQALPQPSACYLHDSTRRFFPLTPSSAAFESVVHPQTACWAYIHQVTSIETTVMWLHCCKLRDATDHN